MEQATLDADTLGLLRESLERYGREKYSFDSRRERLAATDGFGRDAWADYANMGWLAIPMAAEDGGFGNDAQATGALMQYVGQSLVLEPVFASVVLCGRLFSLAGADAVARRSLELLAEGRTIYALAHGEDSSDGIGGEVASTHRDGRLTGRKTIVLHGNSADRFVASAREADGTLGLFLVDATQPKVKREAYRLVDGRGAASVSFDDAEASRLAAGQDATLLLAQALDDARLALCCEILGASRALNAMTLAYLKDRRQFGRPIGTNQALQHRMVELYMLEEEGRCVINAAQRAAPGARRAAILAAVVQLMTLGRQASHEAVQLHGGIGITEELAVSHYFRRLMVTNRLLGDRAAHLDQFAIAVAS